jgi:hypothetical protein
MNSNSKLDVVFTRYLYIKDEVRIALLISILNRSEDSIFWAYELFYSGFKTELFELLWKIYYDFFATLNPAYEVYLSKKYKEWINDTNKEAIIGSIIQDLLFRPFNTDVFFLRNCCESFEIDVDYLNNIDSSSPNFDIDANLKDWIDTNNYRSIAQWILNVNKDNTLMIDIYNICLNNFEKNTTKLTKAKLMKDFMSILNFPSIKNHSININLNVVLLAKIMTLFSKRDSLKMGQSIYSCIEPEDIVVYETVSGFTHYKTLEKASICGIDDFKFLSLFKVVRNKYTNKNTFKTLFWFHWEYYASFSPIWAQRITQFKGKIDHINKKVVFIEEPDDDLMQEFYELYGYEPDEQKKEVQDKSIIDIEKVNNWTIFYNTFKKNGLFSVYEEELDEFDIDRIIY